MIAREVMAYVWCQHLQHLLIVMILDMGEGLSREFLDEVAVDHRFALPRTRKPQAVESPFCAACCQTRISVRYLGASCHLSTEDHRSSLRIQERTAAIFSDSAVGSG